MAPLTPLTCTTNTLCHVDYGIPISAYKSTDYRTCTGTYHRFMPPLPHDFDCRVRANINPSLLEHEPKQKEEYYKTTHKRDYNIKHGDGNISNYVPRPTPFENSNYLRNVQEKMFKNPPPPSEFGVSVTKNTYYSKYPEVQPREVFPPNPNAYCEIKALGRDETPAISPEYPGHYKLMDPYMTTARISYIPFTSSQQDGIARKDIITFYDASNIPRAGKGYGPRNGPAVEPIYQSPNYDMFDRTVFKTHPQKRILPRFPKKIPNFGSTSEYQRGYTLQTHFDSYSTMHTPLVDWEDSLPNASVWQNLSPPGMYCTEYCHTGTGWPVRAVMCQKTVPKVYDRDPDLCRSEIMGGSATRNDSTDNIPCECSQPCQCK